MPTHGEFTAMAHALDSFVEAMSSLPTHLSQAIDPAAIAGGTVGPAVAAALDQSMLNLSTAVTRVDAVAQLCRDRAEQTRRYSDLYRGFESASREYARIAARIEPGDYLGSPPFPPRSPGTWAERG